MFRWQHRRKYNCRARDKAAAPRDRGLVRERIPRREEETIRRARSICCATLLAPYRDRTQAIGKSRNHRAPTIHFAAKPPATDTGQKILRRRRLTKSTMVQNAAPSKRAGERSNKTGSASKNTTTPR